MKKKSSKCKHCGNDMGNFPMMMSHMPMMQNGGDFNTNAGINPIDANKIAMMQALANSPKGYVRLPGDSLTTRQIPNATLQALDKHAYNADGISGAKWKIDPKKLGNLQVNQNQYYRPTESDIEKMDAQLNSYPLGILHDFWGTMGGTNYLSRPKQQYGGNLSDAQIQQHISSIDRTTQPNTPPATAAQKSDPWMGYLTMRTGMVGLSELAGATDRNRQNDYYYNQLSTLGQTDAIPVDDYQPNPYNLYMRMGGNLKHYNAGGGIHIKKANKGKFTASAKRAGMGVQEFASHVLANKDKYSSTLVKRANFARNASKFNH